MEKQSIDELLKFGVYDLFDENFNSNSRVKTSLKSEPVISVSLELTSNQKKIYRAILEKNEDVLDETGVHSISTHNLRRFLSKACFHPFVLSEYEKHFLRKLVNPNQKVKPIEKKTLFLPFSERILNTKRKRKPPTNFDPISPKKSKKSKFRKVEKINYTNEFMNKIPLDVWANIFSYLEITDIASVSQVSKCWNRASRHDRIWKPVCERLNWNSLSPDMSFRSVFERGLEETLIIESPKFEFLDTLCFRLKDSVKSIGFISNFKDYLDLVARLLQFRNIPFSLIDSSMSSTERQKCIDTAGNQRNTFLVSSKALTLPQIKDLMMKLEIVILLDLEKNEHLDHAVKFVRGKKEEKKKPQIIYPLMLSSIDQHQYRFKKMEENQMEAFDFFNDEKLFDTKLGFPKYVSKINSKASSKPPNSNPSFSNASFNSNSNSSFSSASFNNGNDSISLDDPEFWKKVLEN